MAHIHTCVDCDDDFSCDEPEIDSEFREGCSVEPDRCPSCRDAEVMEAPRGER